LLLVATVAFPTADVTLTVDKLNEIIEGILKHKDKIPPLMLEQIEKTTQEEKEQLVDFVNKLHKGEITPTAKNAEELVQFIEEKAPLIGKKARILHEDYKKRVEQLTTQAQEFLKKVSARMR
ncbi:hypothetical protein OESDEN_19547, partial [Oesophagostomum dentatum]